MIYIISEYASQGEIFGKYIIIYIAIFINVGHKT
jgi:hypothetical protein